MDALAGLLWGQVGEHMLPVRGVLPVIKREVLQGQPRGGVSFSSFLLLGSG